MITRTLPQNKTINFVYKQCNQFVDICDIEYIESNEWLCKIYTADDEIICAKRLNYLNSLFAEYGFIRCHKGYIVNMAKIDKINSTKIFLISGKTIPLGRTYKDIVRCEFEKFI